MFFSDIYKKRVNEPNVWQNPILLLQQVIIIAKLTFKLAVEAEHSTSLSFHYYWIHCMKWRS